MSHRQVEVLVKCASQRQQLSQPLIIAPRAGWLALIRIVARGTCSWHMLVTSAEKLVASHFGDGTMTARARRARRPSAKRRRALAPCQLPCLITRTRTRAKKRQEFRRASNPWGHKSTGMNGAIPPSTQSKPKADKVRTISLIRRAAAVWSEWRREVVRAAVLAVARFGFGVYRYGTITGPVSPLNTLPRAHRLLSRLRSQPPGARSSSFSDMGPSRVDISTIAGGR